jgi:hypothetical protein
MNEPDWTTEEDAQLVRCRLACMTFAETAAILGRTKMATETRYYAVRDKRPKPADDSLYGMWTCAMDTVRAAQ